MSCQYCWVTEFDPRGLYCFENCAQDAPLVLQSSEGAAPRAVRARGELISVTNEPHPPPELAAHPIPELVRGVLGREENLGGELGSVTPPQSTYGLWSTKHDAAFRPVPHSARYHAQGKRRTCRLQNLHGN